MDFAADARRVLRWDQCNEWRPRLQALLPELVNEKVAAAVAHQPDDVIVGDSLAWLERALQQAGGPQLDALALATDRLRAGYQFVRGYHGGRPVDLSSYSERGILTLDADLVAAAAERLFATWRPDIPAAIVRAAVEEVMGEGDSRHGHCYFQCDLGVLVDLCSHYMLYGSEFLLGVTAAVARTIGIDLRHRLKEQGMPTVFVCVCRSRTSSTHSRGTGGRAPARLLRRTRAIPRLRHFPAATAAAGADRRALPPHRPARSMGGG